MKPKESDNTIYTRRFIHKELATDAIISLIMNHKTMDMNWDSKVVTKGNKYSFELNTSFNDGFVIMSREKNSANIFQYDDTLIYECTNIKELDGLIKNHLEAVKKC